METQTIAVTETKPLERVVLAETLPEEQNSSAYDLLKSNLCDYFERHDTSAAEREQTLLVCEMMVKLRQAYDHAVYDRKKGPKQRQLLFEHQQKALAKARQTYNFARYDQITSRLEKALYHDNSDQDLKAPAFIIALGYTGTREEKHHIANGKWYEEPVRLVEDKKISYAAMNELEKIAEGDGATIINNQGNLVAKGTVLENLDIQSILYDMGFSKPVNTRHKNVLSASQYLPLFFIVQSEESGDVRVIKEKQIIASTVPGEVKYS